MYRRILVPLDGSPLSERSLPVAIQVARATGARLILLQVVWVSGMPSETLDQHHFRAMQTGTSYLEQIATALTKNDLAVETVVAPGDAVERILEEIALRDIDLVVMSTHGRSGLGRWMYGSVAEAVLHHSRAPVLLVRAADLTSPIPLAHAPSRILVPLDGSAFAEMALPYAVELARAMDASLVLLRAVVPPPLLSPERVVEPGFSAELLELEEEEAHTYLKGTARKLGAEGVKVRTSTRRGPAARAIIDEAEASTARLVVMTTHGRTGIDRLFLGSVASEVLRHGRNPILLVRPRSQAAAAQLATAHVGHA
jgi:nucleotide-binding universal stress UspA family protein